MPPSTERHPRPGSGTHVDDVEVGSHYVYVRHTPAHACRSDGATSNLSEVLHCVLGRQLRGAEKQRPGRKDRSQEVMGLSSHSIHSYSVAC